MGLIANLAAYLAAIYGGTYSVELLLDRYATPEARAEAAASAPLPSNQDEPQE